MYYSITGEKRYLYPSNMHQSIFVQTLKISLELIENNGCMCFNLSGKEQGKERGCTIQYIYFKILYLVYLPPIYIII